MSFKSEVFEQPEVLARLLESRGQQVGAIAEAVRGRDVRMVFIAARGSSDNAALYGKYLWGAINRLPVALATPSLFTIYHAPPRLEGCLVVGVSQSGESPDIVSVVREGRAQGALTLAITNEPASPLAAQSELVLDTGTGPELAVAASKTYTAQLLAMALVCAAVEGDRDRLAELERLPELVREVLALDESIRVAAERYRYMQHCVVLGRGFNYATAYEWSLKLKEMAYVVAEPYSPADFQHGPVAIVSGGFPVFAVAPAGAVFDNVMDLLEPLAIEQRAELVVVSNEERALALARTPIHLPGNLPEWLSPIVAIVPAQLFCYHLTRAMGHDSERPRRLSKITRTW